MVPELEVFWLHNGTLLHSNNSVVYTTSNGNSVFKHNVLSFLTSAPEDKGIYQCVARLIITDSKDITTSKEINVTYAGQYDNVPKN